ncbi:MAG: hypothetical protein KAQ92_01585 [Candidatus Aenigmarchaeota archaeon]|nr:hypothetical protein [Candidatus Aenigmarchaeota archaeon]
MEKMEQIIRISLDLSDKTENRYELVYKISTLATKLMEEEAHKIRQEEFGYETEIMYDSAIKKERPIQHAIMVKASETDEAGLVG